MFLGALLHAGLPLNVLEEALRQLSVEGYSLRYEQVCDKGIFGGRLKVILAEQEQPTRHYSDIAAILEASSLSPSVRKTALAAFYCLAEAEATVHGTTVEEIHFHEVGAIDAIVDITGAAIALEALGITHVYASPLPLTRGHLQMAHGIMPLPAPATLEILRRVQAPWVPSSIEGELVTPTGAALLATMASFQMPAIRIEQVGYGFGQKQLIWPNCVRACIGRASPSTHVHEQSFTSTAHASNHTHAH